MGLAVFTKTALFFALGFLLGSQLVLYRQKLYHEGTLDNSTVLTSQFNATAAPYTSQERLSSGSATLPSASSTPQALPLREITAAMVVLIFSAPLGAGRRHGIRETWLRDAAALNVTAKFLVGTVGLSPAVVGALTAERERFNDMVLVPDVKDCFANLTRKLLKGMVWAIENVDFEHLMKADDDTYVRFDQALAGIRRIQPQYRSNIYWGYFGAGYPFLSGKYAEKNWDHLCPNYFPYTYGSCYILSQGVVRKVVQLSEKLFVGYNNDDVSVGAWLAPFDIVRIHDLRFTYLLKHPSCKSDFISSHAHNPSTQRTFYQRLKMGVQLCAKPFSGMGRWIYNWGGPPSKCCRQLKRQISFLPSAFARGNRNLQPFSQY